MSLQDDTQALYATKPFVTFQWRGSRDGIVWSVWRYFDAAELDTAKAICAAEEYGYIQARRLENGFEVLCLPIVTWEG